MPLCSETVNPKEKLGPSDFDLLKVLGKGGYGKVCEIDIFKFENEILNCLFFLSVNKIRKMI